MLNNQQINIIVNTLKPYNPKRIGIFGSYARSEDSDTSDIDIMYLFQSPITLFHLVDIKESLEKQLGREVDLVSENFINKNIKNEIIKDYRIIYEK